MGKRQVRSRRFRGLSNRNIIIHLIRCPLHKKPKKDLTKCICQDIRDELNAAIKTK